MKRYLSIIASLLMLCTFSARAGVENATTLVIQNVSGEIVEFPLENSPKMTFKNTYVIVQAGINKIFKVKDIKKAYFTDETTAVNAVTTEEEIAAQANTIIFSSFAPNTPVRVYTPGGMIVKQAYTDAEGRLQLSIDDLHRGTYIIKGGKTVMKYKK